LSGPALILIKLSLRKVYIFTDKMAPRLSKQQLQQKKRDNEKLRQKKIKENPEALAVEKAKRHQKYLNRIAKKQVKLIADMTPRDARKKRKQWRQNTKNKRARAKELVNFLKSNTPETSDDDDYVPNVVLVKDGRKTSARKRALRNRSAQNRKLQSAVKYAQKYKNMYFRLLRSSNLPSAESSPRTKVRKTLNGRRVDSDIRKKLLFGEVLNAQLAENYEQRKGFKSRQLFAHAVSGKIIRKYRCFGQTKDFLKSKTVKGLHTSLPFKYSRKPNVRMEKVSKDIESFLSRDKFSRLCPGKKDTLTRNKVKKQKRLMNMSLKDLHVEFVKEQSYKICYATFCRLRPFWVVDPKVTERDTCLCCLHANTKFLTEALYRYGVVDYKKPQDFCTDLCCEVKKEECMLRKCLVCRNKCISYKQFNCEQTASFKKWATIKESRIDNHGKPITVQITKKTVVDCTVGELIDQIEVMMPKFMVHTANITHQYETIDELKQSLTPNKIILHIDFSENFSCKYSAEVQSVHFGASRQQVSLHTGVLYYKDATDETLRTLAFCTSSDNLRHDPAAIWAHLSPMLKYAKENISNIQEVHFVSDGPTTQYRNKKNFYLLYECIEKFFPDIVSASWNFSEAGHGKGAMDGVGAAIKQTADRHIAHGNDVASYAELLLLLKEHCKGVLLTDMDLADIIQFESILAGKPYM
jgi:hypothetical protein